MKMTIKKMKIKFSLTPLPLEEGQASFVGLEVRDLANAGYWISLGFVLFENHSF